MSTLTLQPAYAKASAGEHSVRQSFSEDWDERKFMNYKNTVWLLPFICFIIGYCVMSWLLRPAAMPMPSLINHSLHDATKVASAHHLNIRILREQENAQLTEGTVIDQIPSPKSLVKHYQTVFLVITKKAARPRAPHLLNLSATAVEHTLNELSIPYKVFNLYAQIPEGTCVAQMPQPDQEVGTEGMVVYISRGPVNTLIMPSVKGQSVEHVQELAQQAGMRLTVQHAYPVTENHQCNCHVYDQQPRSGSLFTADSSAHLLVLVGQ